MSVIGLVILAAGGSTRLGTPKQLLLYEGRSLLRRAAETAVSSSCAPIMVVLGAEAERCSRELHDLPISTVENVGWSDGMGSSLRLGLESLLNAAPSPLDAVIIMLCDQPLLTVATLKALKEKYERMACPIVASDYGEAVGVPALFDRSVFPDLLKLLGQQGARQILHRYPDQTQTIAFPNGGIDIDTAADFARLSHP